MISDIAEFSRFPWLVRVRDLQVIGAFGFREGIPYTYLALNIGKLHYYPAVLQQRYLPDWDDFLCEPHEAMRTSREHHVSLAYLPVISRPALVYVVGLLNCRIEEWVQLRWFPNARLSEFSTCLRRMLVTDEPLPPRANIPGNGYYTHLMGASDETLRMFHESRRLHGSWAWDFDARCFIKNPANLAAAVTLRNRNRQRLAANGDIVRQTAELPYMPFRYRAREPRSEWLDFLPCFLKADSPTLSTPSEMHELCFGILQAASEGEDLRQFRRIFEGHRDGTYKAQRLGDLHVTPIANAAGTFDTEICCPRVDRALGR